MLEVLSRRVFAAFHRFEAALTRFTDRVGVYCVFFCTVLLVLGTITFFDVYFADIFLGPNVSLFTTLAGTLWSVYLVCNIAFHYWSAVTILPGSPSDPPGTVRTRSFLSWKNQRSKAKPHKLSDTESRRRRHQRILDAQRAAILSASNTSTRTCKRCPLVQDPRSPDTWKQPAKPERAHHCSICATCWLAFDHHCPWINGCVGLYNARYFLLFMVHMALACSSVALLGFKTMLGTLDFRESWPHITPRPFTLLLWVLSVAMAFALTVMSLWQIWLVGKNETSVEANDNDYYRKLTKRTKRDFLPPYDLGWRENLADFFSVGPDRHPWWTVLLPLRIEPVSDGWVWSKRPGWHLAKVEEAEMLTDEEGG